ncbi:hypothetical protein AB0N14_16410 [Streptomyces sp. NPDC051104]|uniref:hypothetical protein n=1 Tax=Streptomyces sp. NPDC051104 TaxID=3155044 RepID=UPI00342735AB
MISATPDPDRGPECLDEFAGLATAHAGLPLKDFVHTLADHGPSDGHDDMAILALRTPAL